MCVIRLPCPYGSGEVSYITSHHVLGDIIQPAGVGLLQIITGTGVYFISPINALQSWYSTPPFDSFCFLYFPTSPSRHNKKAQGWRFPSACELSELSFKYFSQSNVFSWTLEERTILTGTKGEFFFLDLQQLLNQNAFWIEMCTLHFVHCAHGGLPEPSHASADPPAHTRSKFSIINGAW